MRARWAVLCLYAVSCSDGWAQEAVFRAEASLVEVYASVFDRNGNPLPSLTRDRFQVLDGGKGQSLVAFEGAEERLSVALLLDLTGSMDRFLPTLKLSALRFIEMLREKDEVAVYSFNTSLRVRQRFTADKALAKRAILRTTAGGGTALFDSISRVSRDLQEIKGKKALVVFTDGDDNASTLPARSASNQARRAGIAMYTIAQGAALKAPDLVKVLAETAALTGGAAFSVEKPEEIGAVFAQITHNLKNTYLLAWKVPDQAGSGWRPIAVSVTGAEGAKIRARQGYWPP
ncbi:MAG: VWA domain-containing protein [Bryobacterales bacterium]|nr:VWA domain-containing protein [Bryobacterales bacterium]